MTNFDPLDPLGIFGAVKKDAARVMGALEEAAGRGRPAVLQIPPFSSSKELEEFLESVPMLHTGRARWLHGKAQGVESMLERGLLDLWVTTSMSAAVDYVVKAQIRRPGKGAVLVIEIPKPEVERYTTSVHPYIEGSVFMEGVPSSYITHVLELEEID